MHDYDAFNMYSNGYQDEDDPLMIQQSFINTKPDCDSINDSGRRFIPSNLTPLTEYLEDDENLPPATDIPLMAAIK